MMINTGCEVDYRFRNGFILEPEHLHTLVSKIKERYPSEELLFRITKSDSYIYITTDINDVLDEENGSSNFIKKIELLIKNENIIEFNLCFEKNEDTLLRIKGSNRDNIYLLYNEIKTYVEKDITTVKLFFKKDSFSRLVLFITTIPLIGCMLLLISLLRNKRLFDESNELAKEVLSSQDISLKLNYLIEKDTRYKNSISFSQMKYFEYMMVGTLLIMLLSMVFRSFIGKDSAFRITDYFLFGKQRDIYEKKVKFKNNVLWTVFIGLVISVVAGVIVAKLT